MCKKSLHCNCHQNPQFPYAPTREAFGHYPSDLTPLLPQQIGIPVGQIPTGGFKVVGDGGFQLMSNINATLQGVGQIGGTIDMQSLTNQTKDF